MGERPIFENAPGLVMKPRVGAWEARWCARADLVQRGWLPKSLALWKGTEPTDADRQFVSDQCNSLQNEMLVWGRGGTPEFQFDGTLGSVVRAYQTDPDSNYHKIRYATRSHYVTLCKSIVKDRGHELLSDIKARHLLRWHEEWTLRGESIAHALIGMLRTVVGFGKIFLEDPECKRISEILSDMRFKMGKKRDVWLNQEQVIKVRDELRCRGLYSIALAQAFQFDLMLRQKDAIGEWVPQTEPGLSDILDEGSKWLRGIRWEEIRANGVLKHITSKRQKEIIFNLHNAPMVLQELAYSFGYALTADGQIDRGSLPVNGPIIISEATGLPWAAFEYRRQWRAAATACGLPKDIFNMDTRSGAITEAFLAGADPESVRQAATHSNIATTQGYSRNAEAHTERVAKIRIAHGNKTGTPDQENE